MEQGRCAHGVRRRGGQRERCAASGLMRPRALIGGAIAEDDPLPPDDRRETGREPLLSVLYREHRLRLLGFVRRRRSGDDAEDVVQQAYCRLAGFDQGKLGTIDQPEAYLMTASRNLIRDEARARARRSADLHVDACVMPLEGYDQVAALEARDVLRRIEAALTRLKPRTREIFLAHRIDGYSYAEIAARTGLSIKTIEMHMTRAIAYLHRHRTGQ